MIPSEVAAFDRIFTTLGVACREDLDDAMKRTYFGLLQDVPLELLGKAARRWVEDGHAWFPAVGAWRQMVDAVQAVETAPPVYRALPPWEREEAAADPSVFAKMRELVDLGKQLRADRVAEEEVQRIVAAGAKAAFPATDDGPRLTVECPRCGDTGFQESSRRPGYVEFCPCRPTNATWQRKQAPVRKHYANQSRGARRNRGDFRTVGEL